MATVLDQLKHLVNQIDDGGCSASPCPCPQPAAANFPYLQVCMLDPPCNFAPTEPKYVKPLQLPSAPTPACHYDPDEDIRLRRSNFYNYYNVDYHKTGTEFDKQNKCKRSLPCRATTVGGKNPHCEDYKGARQKHVQDEVCEGCPTGFKPCRVQLCPPPACHPLGTWKATILPCPPKPRKRVSYKYTPGECTRPCCKHWKPKGGVCKYDQPCKAHCYDHPPGIKSSGRKC